MTLFKQYLLLAGFVLFGFILVPAVSHAATVTVVATTQAQELNSELNQIKAQLDSASTTASFTLSPGQSITQAAATSSSSSNSNGTLSVSFPSILHTATTSDSTLPVVQLAKINLSFSPCVTAGLSNGIPAGVNVCTAGPTPFPVMTSELMQGQSTNYLTYNIGLSQLSSSSATFVVADSSFLSNIQSEIDTVAAKVHAFLGTGN